MTLPLIYSKEVAQAQSAGQAIVALESTIITHGMPWPRNLDMCRAVEDIIRFEGAVPATIAVFEGQIHIGLENHELEWLANTKDAMKLSRADLAACISSEKTGATTVAATMICAELAGITTFATGGIGGVHRGAETNFDISADLNELAQTSVTVVCAGAKAILDIPKTLEVLETNGVPVIGYQTDLFPAFWSSTSPYPAPIRLDSPEEIAHAFNLQAALGLKAGQLIANPVPQNMEIPSSEIDPIIDLAILEAEKQAISAKAVTPFLLSRIFELTKGRSLETNIALVENNARLAAQIARAKLAVS